MYGILARLVMVRPMMMYSNEGSTPSPRFRPLLDSLSGNQYRLTAYAERRILSFPERNIGSQAWRTERRQCARSP